MSLRNNIKNGCTYEFLDVNGDIKIQKHNDVCFAGANNYKEGQLNIIEPKINIKFSIDEINEYLELISKTNCFLDIKFVPDYNEEEYLFIINKSSDTPLSKFKGTYTVVRYLWGDGECNNFHIIVSNFLNLSKKYNFDLYTLLQLSHFGLSKYFNSNHSLILRSFNIIKGIDINYNSEFMNVVYSSLSDYLAIGKVDLIDTNLEELIKELENEQKSICA